MRAGRERPSNAGHFLLIGERVSEPYGADPALILMALISRARARGARRWRRELGDGVRQHPGSNNCVEGPRW